MAKKYTNSMGKMVAILLPNQPEYIKLVHIIEYSSFVKKGWVSAIKFYKAQIEKWEALLETTLAAEEYGNVYPILDDQLGTPIDYENYDEEEIEDNTTELNIG